MGLFWDLFQQSQISGHSGQLAEQGQRATQLEDRVRMLEKDHDDLQQLVQQLILRLEQHFGEDINKDGKIG